MTATSNPTADPTRQFSPAYKDRYLPIAEYGIIGNLHTTALVSVTGSIDFMCLPRFDSPTVFGRLLDADKGGFFSFECLAEDTKNKQLYLPGTNILITRFLSEDGIAELTDFMPIVDEELDFAVFRRLKGVYGHHRVRLDLRPRYGYGKRGCIAEKNPEGRGYLIRDPEGEQPTLLLLTDVAMDISDDGLSATIDLRQGDNLDFILTLNQGVDFDLDWMRCFTACRKYWTTWSRKCTYDGFWKEPVLRSVLALKLLTSARYGSTIAAATFGLPEKMGGERNWDYRYTWIRDSAFTMYAFLRLGYREEAEGFMDWIREKCRLPATDVRRGRTDRAPRKQPRPPGGLPG